MNENLYNYDALYGNGLAAKSYTPEIPYRPTLSTQPPAQMTSSVAPNATVDPALQSPTGLPSWLANTQALGTLGLGLASFLDQRKTAGLQRDALRQNLSVAREHQANRKALGNSWNQAWSQS